MAVEKVVKEGYHCVSSLATSHSIDEVVDLFRGESILTFNKLIAIHLAWYSLTSNTKESALPWRQEIHRSGLEGVRGEVHLLCKIKAVMHFSRCTMERSLLVDCLHSFTCLPIEWPLSGRMIKVFFVWLEHLKEQQGTKGEINSNNCYYY